MYALALCTLLAAPPSEPIEVSDYSFIWRVVEHENARMNIVKSDAGGMSVYLVSGTDSIVLSPEEAQNIGEALSGWEKWTPKPGSKGDVVYNRDEKLLATLVAVTGTYGADICRRSGGTETSVILAKPALKKFVPALRRAVELSEYIDKHVRP
jgi:hypothetical protein